MTRVALGRYAMPFYDDGPIFFASNAFWEPDHDIFGAATSTHHYDLYPIAERDVQVAIDIVHVTLGQHKCIEPMSRDVLQCLLRAIHREFGKIDMHVHIAGIEFNRSPDAPQPADDPQSIPRVQIVLLQLRRGRLSIASVGDFLVYRVRPTGQELFFGYNWFSHKCAGIEPEWPGPVIGAYVDDMPRVNEWEEEVEPGDLIVVATHSLTEVMALARLDQFVRIRGCDPEAVAHHLMDTVHWIVTQETEDSSNPYRSTKFSISEWGAAWAVAHVEK